MSAAYAVTNPLPSLTAISNVILGLSINELYVMWQDGSNVKHILCGFGGSSAGTFGNHFYHYINTDTDDHVLLDGNGVYTPGRHCLYDSVHNKFYATTDYGTVGKFNEINPAVNPATLTTIATGTANGTSATSFRGALDICSNNSLIFVAFIPYNYDGIRVYSYDPAVGAASWTDLGIVYNPDNHIEYTDRITSRTITIDATNRTFTLSSGSWEDYPQLAVGKSVSFLGFSNTQNNDQNLTISNISGAVLTVDANWGYRTIALISEGPKSNVTVRNTYWTDTTTNPVSLGADSDYIYAVIKDQNAATQSAFIDGSGKNYYHLMSYEIGVGPWTEVVFPDAKLSWISSGDAIVIYVDDTTADFYCKRYPFDSETPQYFWLVGGGVSAVTGSVTRSDIKKYGCASTLTRNDNSQFELYYDYDIDTTDLYPTASPGTSRVLYGAEVGWPGNAVTSDLTFTDSLYALAVDGVLQKSSTEMYAFYSNGPVQTRGLTDSSSTPQGFDCFSYYCGTVVPSTLTQSGSQEAWYGGYSVNLMRWIPGNDPSSVAWDVHFNYCIRLHYDSQGKIWAGRNTPSGSSTGPGGVVCYNPATSIWGTEIFGTGQTYDWTATGTPTTLSDICHALSRTKIVVSGEDNYLYVIDAATQTVDGRYNLGTSGFMVEVATDQVMIVTVDNKIGIFQPSSRTMSTALQDLGITVTNLYGFGVSTGHINNRIAQLIKGPDGYAWMFCDEDLYRINPTTLEFTNISTPTGGHGKLCWIGANLVITYGEPAGGVADARYYPGLLYHIGRTCDGIERLGKFNGGSNIAKINGITL